MLMTNGTASSTSSESGVVEGNGVDGGVENVVTEQALLRETVLRQRTMLDDLERRLGETEYFLDGCESDIHRRRSQERGDNYLQDVYLVGGGAGLASQAVSSTQGVSSSQGVTEDVDGSVGEIKSKVRCFSTELQ